jgi:putative pyruvate formate lyase activating enzyme
MLYNEGPLIGAPTFSVFVRGCSLRCSFCYRPEELAAKSKAEMSADTLAGILDDATSSGAQSWHFLGGNPDESIPAILEVLSLTRKPLPIAWNSALMLTPEALELLKGVVDIWIPDFKFGNDSCARRIGHIDGYKNIVTRNLLALRNQQWVVVRHMKISGHKDCCTEYINSFVRERLPIFHYQEFPVANSEMEDKCLPNQ